MKIPVLLLATSAIARAGAPADVAAWCAALQDRTLQIRGTALLYGGSTDRGETVATEVQGSGFWMRGKQRGMVLTAAHVVDGLTAIEVCEGADAAVCHEVVSIATHPDRDLAVLWTTAEPSNKLRVRLGEVDAPGQSILSAGYGPGGGNFPCEQGKVAGVLDPDAAAPFLLIDAPTTIGSAGGPIVAWKGKGKPGKFTAVGVNSGVETWNEVRVGRAAPAAAITGDEAGTPPQTWRRDEAWRDTREVTAAVDPGSPLWTEVRTQALQDFRVSRRDGDDGALCMGFYALPTDSLAVLASVDPAPIATTCDARELVITTRRPGTLRLALWTEGAVGYQGTVDLSWR